MAGEAFIAFWGFSVFLVFSRGGQKGIDLKKKTSKIPLVFVGMKVERNDAEGWGTLVLPLVP